MDRWSRTRVTSRPPSGRRGRVAGAVAAQLGEQHAVAVREEVAGEVGHARGGVAHAVDDHEAGTVRVTRGEEGAVGEPVGLEEDRGGACLALGIGGHREAAGCHEWFGAAWPSDDRLTL